jgi:plastocyanin
MSTSSRTHAVILAGAVVGAAVTACGGSDGGGSGPRTFPQAASVTASTSQAFTPGSVDIAAGGIVTWSFGALAHNVTFQTTNSPDDVPTTMNGEVPRPFPTSGTYHYICTIHPGMSGTIIVH